MIDDATGRVVLVTGAGRACGRVIAEDLAARHAHVVVNDIDPRTGAETVDRITAEGGEATLVVADVADDAQVARMVDACVETYGRLDVAVNNAGIEVPVEVADSTPEQFAAVLATNLQGVRSCVAHEIRALRAGGRGGAILNMSSVSSDLAAARGNGLYAAAKGGVDGLTKTVAVEVAAEGISVNALSFIGADVEGGMFQRFVAETGIPEEELLDAIPAGRKLRPEELCAAVRYLTSEEARFVIGTNMVLDGGFTAM